MNGDDLEAAEMMAKVAAWRHTRDQASARCLIATLYPLIIAIVRRRLPRRMSEEDLAQEVFVRFFERLDEYDGRVPLSHWVARIAVNRCIDLLRAEKRRPELRWADLSEKEAEKTIKTTLGKALKLFYNSGLTPAEVIDLIPVKPIGEHEAEITEIYQNKLMGLFSKIKP